jgi:hypothetical protein
MSKIVTLLQVAILMGSPPCVPLATQRVTIASPPAFCSSPLRERVASFAPS